MATNLVWRSFQLEESDDLPQCICSSCSSRLIDHFLFKRTCEKSLALLQRVLNIPALKPWKQSPSEVTKVSLETQPDAESLSEIKDQAEEVRKLEIQSEHEKRSIKEMENEKIESIEPGDPENGQNSNDEYIFQNEDDSKLAQISNEVQMHRCFYCKKQLANNDDLKLHLMEHIEIVPIILTTTKFYRCARCLLVLTNVKRLCDHLNAKSACENKQANLEDKYHNHSGYDLSGEKMGNVSIFSCLKKDDDSICCEACETSSDNLYQLVEHCEKDHLFSNNDAAVLRPMNMSHSCGVCGATSMNLREALFHVYFHQEQFKCPLDGCMNSYEKFTFLNRHIAREHFSGTYHKCGHCVFETENYDDFKKHLRVGCTQRNFKCSYCGEFVNLLAFNHLFDVSSHSLDKKFLTKNSMVGHQRRIHLQVKNFRCATCEKQFSQSTDLKNHIRYVT